MVCKVRFVLGVAALALAGLIWTVVNAVTTVPSRLRPRRAR